MLNVFLCLSHTLFRMSLVMVVLYLDVLQDRFKCHSQSNSVFT